jgi:hypothetical protein
MSVQLDFFSVSIKELKQNIGSGDEEFRKDCYKWLEKKILPFCDGYFIEPPTWQIMLQQIIFEGRTELDVQSWQIDMPAAYELEATNKWEEHIDFCYQTIIEAMFAQQMVYDGIWGATGWGNLGVFSNLYRDKDTSPKLKELCTYILTGRSLLAETPSNGYAHLYNQEIGQFLDETGDKFSLLSYRMKSAKEVEEVELRDVLKDTYERGLDIFITYG